LKTARERRTGLEQEAFIAATLAEAYLGRGQGAASRRAAEDAAAIAQRAGTPLFAAVAELALARALRLTDGASGIAAIRNALERAHARIEETGGRSYEPFVHLELAELAGLAGNRATREHELREAHRLFLAIGAPIRAAEIEKRISNTAATVESGLPFKRV
jgi:hypothetical protein